jgi:hypothetical protein
MLNADDPTTVASLKRLRKIVNRRERPIVLWVGAGASKWAGLPSWEELARILRREMFDLADGFDNQAAVFNLNKNNYTAVFELCKQTNQQIYYRALARILGECKAGDVYVRFVCEVRKLAPFFVVTTNADLCLEQHLPGSIVVEPSNIERLTALLNEQRSFVGKLHGSVSAIEKAVFTSEDYRQLLQDKQFQSQITALFNQATVIFIGYGLKDRYVLDLLSEDADNKSLFGNGPHFVLTPNTGDAPVGVHRINYSIARFGDHRAALTILDYLQQCRPVAEITEDIAPVLESKNESAFYISDFKPPGTYQDGFNITYASLDKTAGQHSEGTLRFGLGFVTEELPTTTTRALHDLLVGLICFDRIYLPFLSAFPLLATVGEDIVKRLLESEVLTFVHSEQDPAIRFDADVLMGSVSLITPRGKDGVAPRSPRELLERFITPVLGKEQQAEQLFEQLTTRTVRFAEAEHLDLLFLVREAILMPEVSRLLGVGDAVVPSTVPSWLSHPYLRLAHLIQTELICSNFNIQAARVPFGGPRLISAAFGLDQSVSFADQYASYVFSGRFDSNLSFYVQQNPAVLFSVLGFRESQQGISLRAEIRDMLRANRATEFSTSVDAGLKQNVPTGVLDAARDRLLSLLAPENRTAVPAVWTEPVFGDGSTRLWRRRAERELLRLCEERAITKDSACICGSGDKLRMCCLV